MLSANDLPQAGEEPVTPPQTPQERDPSEDKPYALLLIDANTLIYKEQKVNEGFKGGADVTHQLLSAICFDLRIKGLEHCRIMVCIYASAPNMAEEMTPFIAGFSQAFMLYDFVELGVAPADIGGGGLWELLRLHGGDDRCGHIYFAVHVRQSHINEMDRVDMLDKVSLICTHGGGGC